MSCELAGGQAGLAGAVRAPATCASRRTRSWPPTSAASTTSSTSGARRERRQLAEHARATRSRCSSRRSSTSSGMPARRRSARAARRGGAAQVERALAVDLEEPRSASSTACGECRVIASSRLDRALVGVVVRRVGERERAGQRIATATQRVPVVAPEEPVAGRRCAHCRDARGERAGIAVRGEGEATDRTATPVGRSAAAASARARRSPAGSSHSWIAREDRRSEPAASASRSSSAASRSWPTRAERDAARARPPRRSRAARRAHHCDERVEVASSSRIVGDQRRPTRASRSAGGAGTPSSRTRRATYSRVVASASAIRSSTRSRTLE